MQYLFIRFVCLVCLAFLYDSKGLHLVSVERRKEKELN